MQILFGKRDAALELPAFAKYLWQGGISSVDEPEEGDHFGHSLVAGNFDGDGFDDLAIGIPGEDIDGFNRAGAIEVRYGDSNRADALETFRQFFHENTTGVPDAAAAGDFDHDHFDELVVGVPYEQNFLGPEEGDVVVLSGSPTGPQAVGARTWNLQAPGILGDMNPGDHLGWSLAVGDFDDDLHADLALGTPYDGGIGGVMVLYGALFADNFETGTTALWSAAVP